MRKAPPASVSLALTAVLSAVVTTVLALTGTPAVSLGSAQSALPDRDSVIDEVGDAPVGIDLRSGTFVVSRKKMVFSVRVRGLGDRTFVAFESLPLAAAWDRIAIYREKGRTVGKVYFIDNEEVPTPYLRRCPGLEVTWKPARSKVRAVVPRRCLQASQFDGPYVMRAYTRFGGVAGSKRDTLPRVKLDR